jgi:hypothetical protein
MVVMEGCGHGIDPSTCPNKLPPLRCGILGAAYVGNYLE